MDGRKDAALVKTRTLTYILGDLHPSGVCAVDCGTCKVACSPQNEWETTRRLGLVTSMDSSESAALVLRSRFLSNYHILMFTIFLCFSPHTRDDGQGMMNGAGCWVHCHGHLASVSSSSRYMPMRP